jgi:hypothetical protein
MGEFWFNTTTGQVDEGHRAAAAHLLGPYPTREAAEKALESARARTEAWDREDADD